jgi:hypothetical protein
MSRRPPRPEEPQPEERQRDDRLGAAFSGLPVPDHGPTFWADLNHRLQGETVPHQTESAIDAGPARPTAPSAPTTEAIDLDDRRARRAARRGDGRFTRSLGAAAAAVALVVAAAGAVTVINRDDNADREVRTADRPAGTAQPGPGAAKPTRFSATYDGIEGWDGPDGCCSQWRLILDVGADASYRWTSTDDRADIAYDDVTGRHVEKITIGPDASASRPKYLITTGVPAGGPDRRIARPEPLDPIADFVTALARSGDRRISESTVAGRATWHYDGPIAVDRLGGDAAPNHVVADVDQVTQVLLHLTRRVDDLVVNRFTASDIVLGEGGDNSVFRLEPSPGASTMTLPLGFDGPDRTLSDADVAAAVPYDLLIPAQLPENFRRTSMMLNRDVPSPTGPEGMNPPVTSVVAMTYAGDDGRRFSVTLRPRGEGVWDDPFRGEGVVPESSPVRFELPDRPPLEGSVVVAAPSIPHLWGITGDVVVTISGDLSRAELERVGASLRPHRG